MINWIYIDKHVIKLTKNFNFCAIWFIVKHMKGLS